MMDKDILRWGEQENELNNKYAEIPISKKNPTVLKVKIISGFDINRNSYLDYVDTPNPQIVLEYPGAVGHKKFETTSKIDTVEPVWNESFRFVLPEEEEVKSNEHKVKFSLMVEDWYSSSVNIGEAFFDPSNLRLDEKLEKVISFGKSGKLNVRITKKKKSYLRLSLSLCEKELEFRRKRLPKVMKSFQRALGDDTSPNNIFETPIMSLMASGGGIRATTAMCGVMEGLDKIGLLDCMMYALGTSGGSWYLSSAYARKAFKGKKRENYHRFLRNSFNSACFWEMVKYPNMMRCRELYEAKTKVGQPFTLVDYYGICASNKVLAKKYSSTKLSDLRSYVETADVPYLILNSSQVTDLQDVKTYRADCNWTPYECEMPQYGVNVDTTRLNSLFHSGVMERKLPEPNLAYMIGTLGSFFALRLNRILGLDYYNEMLEPKTSEEGPKKRRISGASGLSPQSSESNEVSRLEHFLKWISSLPTFCDRSMFVERTGQILNIAKGFGDMKRHRINPFAPEDEERFDGFVEKDEAMNLIDGGVLCNIAVDAALRPQRRNDILFVADITSYHQDISFKTLTTSIRLANEGGYKFPPVDIEKIKREKTKELYIFEDENDLDCPLVFWLLTTTDKFKQIPNYTPRYKSVLKDLPEGEKFNHFDVMDSDTYDTFNTSYSNLEFDRLRELMLYNVTVNEEVIKNKIRERIERKRKFINAAVCISS